MSDLRPLREVSESAVTRSLLESAKKDRAPQGAAARALAGLGIGAAGVIGASSAKATGTTATGAAASTKGAFALWVGVGVIASGVAAGVHHEMSARAPAPPVSVSPTVTVPRVDVVAPPPPTKTEHEHEPTPAPSAVRPPAPRASARAWPTPMTVFPPASAASAASAPTVGLRELLEIRGALRDHEPARALVLLDRLDGADPSARLFEETAVLRIDALTDLGKREEASTLARRFLASHPNSAYAARVRTTLPAP